MKQAGMNRAGMNRAGGMADQRGAELFSARVLAAIFIVGILAFVGVLYLEVFTDGGEPDYEVSPTTYSSSALGHKALLETLRRLQIPVIVSRFKSGEKAGAGSLLVLLEPNPEQDEAKLIGGFGNLKHGLLVLPKWTGEADRKKPSWVGSMDLLPEEAVKPILDKIQVHGKLKRLKGTYQVKVPELGGTIEITDPQIMVGAKLKSVVRLEEGTLIGETNFGTGKQWVVSDPDFIANHGIDEADNAVVAVSMIDRLRPAGGVVVFDETAHGFEQRPNLMKTALQLPFGIVTLSAIVAVLLAVWGGIVRFGRPQADGRALQPGKVTLIRTAADLLHQAGRRGGAVELVLTRYLRAQIADTLAQVNAPRGLDERRQIAWLDNLASTRNPDFRLQPLADAIENAAKAGKTDPARALRLAADLHAWKQEYLHGLGKASGHR
jgi:hypothetical protein